ncbi:DUF6011 domain-containing protein [Streptomyces albidoflavus]|uniref:DUF6011 domain-containing protein n=1 Tax=Streptomyces albidoflavus TaxID=1886 RepID=UPI0033E8DCC0
MAFVLSAPLVLLGYDGEGRPDFGLVAPVSTSAAGASVPKQERVERNRFPGFCPCGGRVPESKGRRVREDGKWITRHMPGECISGEEGPARPASQNRWPLSTPPGAEAEEGYFTAQFGQDSDDYVTMRIRRQGAESKFRPGELIATYLSGPDNERSYTGFAHIDSRGRGWIWKKYADNARLREALASVLGDQKAAGEAWARRSKRCWKCALPLTTPESLDALMGRECARKQSGA